jgi:spore germination cell wall hydrolase CwlJ-like protein
MLDGNKYADMQPEVPTSQLQKYTLPEAALVPPAPQAEINNAVSLARETIPDFNTALAAVEKLHNAGVYSGEALDKAGEMLGAHLRARDAGIPVDEALRLSRAEGPRMVNQGMPSEERPPVQPLAYTAAPAPAPAAAAIDKLTARAPQGPDLNDRQRDLIIRTIAAETSGKTPEESQAIAHVILNRIQSGKYGATPEAVLFARKQFEPWSNPNGANYPMRFTPESRRYGLGQTALDAALGAEDITNGATNFWAPKAQAALGRRPPKWGRTGGVDIGETRFHNLSRAHGGLVDDALHVVREHHADGEAVGTETNALGMTPDQFAEYTQTKAPPAPGFVESALRNVREYAMPRAEDYTHAMDQSASAADYLIKSGKEGMLSGNPWEMAKGAGKSMLGTALPVIAPVGAAFEAGIINPAERVLGPAGRHAAEVATMVPSEGVGAAMKIARATGEAAPYAAIFAGPMAKTADIHALEIAKDLATKGADRGEIIGKTGWFQGSDGKWRFEIPDVQSKVTDQVYNNIKEKGIHEGTLPTALEHPELYEAYPQLNEMQATFGASAKSRGSYSPWSKDISVEGPSVANQRSTALHEAQHAVQQIEDFARGADNIYLKPNTPAWDIYQERLKAIKTPMTPKQFEESGVGSPEYSYSEYLKQTKDSIKNNGPMLNRAAQDYAVQEAYRRSAGEVEARNVQARRNMDPSALKTEMPWQTQSVPNEQQIVKFHNAEPQMSVADYQGEHSAPMKDSGSPLYNVTGVYPKDFYSGKGFQYYADLGSEKNMDRSSYGTINSYLGMPDRPITVYRAVPKDPDIKGINKGDWVTINRDYAKEHGQGALNGDYKILKKQVYARDLFTAGDSHHEWGYDPQPASGLKREDKAAMRKDVRGYEKGGSVEDRALMLVSQQA